MNPFRVIIIVADQIGVRYYDTKTGPVGFDKVHAFGVPLRCPSIHRPLFLHRRVLTKVRPALKGTDNLPTTRTIRMSDAKTIPTPTCNILVHRDKRPEQACASSGGWQTGVILPADLGRQAPDTQTPAIHLVPTIPRWLLPCTIFLIGLISLGPKGHKAETILGGGRGGCLS